MPEQPLTSRLTIEDSDQTETQNRILDTNLETEIAHADGGLEENQEGEEVEYYYDEEDVDENELAEDGV